MKILLTGVEGPAGICFAKSLSEVAGLELIGADAGEVKISAKFLKNFYTIPFANDDQFIKSIHDIVEKEKIDYLIPLVDEELNVVASNIDKISCPVLISPAKTLGFTIDKGLLYEHLSAFLPKRFNITNAIFPVFVKPRVGRGSRDIHMVSDKAELASYDESKYVIQEVLSGPEITVDTLFDFDGKLIVAVPRIRSGVKENISIMGKVVNHTEILAKIKEISKILKFIGPVNFQFMNSANGFKLIEINARSSGGMGITINSGVDIPKLTYELLSTGVVANVPTLKEGEFPNFEEIIQRQVEKEAATKI